MERLHENGLSVRIFGRRVLLRTINRWVIGLTVGVAIFYPIIYLSQFVWGGASDKVTGVMPGNPRIVICLFLITAALTSVYLGDIGRILAAGFFGMLIAFFIYWGYVTFGIKQNLGSLPRATTLQNLFIGATGWDLLILFAAVLLFCADVWTVGEKWRLRDRIKRNKQSIGTPLVAQK